MAPSYSISEIGYNPLGNLGLGVTGQYGSYDAYMPSSLAMNYGIGMGGSIFPMAGMYGMYNPVFMAQMQQQVEASQAIHNGNMHGLLLDNEVNAHQETDSALMRKMLTNGDIQQGIGNLYDKVRAGDQDGICNEFDKLKGYIFNTYRDEFKARNGKINPSASATQYIEAIYSQLASSWAGDGQVHSLRDDIQRYGDGSFQNGFMTGFRKGHHERYIDETMSHCFGMRIDQKESKDMRKGLGNGVGRVASGLEKGIYGAAAGVGAATIGCGLGKLISFGKLPTFTKFGRTAGFAACLGAIAGIAADIYWQISKD